MKPKLYLFDKIPDRIKDVEDYLDTQDKYLDMPSKMGTVVLKSKHM